MNDAIRKFKISNMPDTYMTCLIPFSIMVFIVGGGLMLSGAAISGSLPEALIGILAIVLIILGFGMPFLVSAGMKADIEYDGKHIKLNSFFKKKEINLEHVKNVAYWHEPGSGRYRVDGITLEFTLFPSGEEEYEETIQLYDKLSNDDESTDLDRLIKGDHSGFPLLLLYDDIVEMYPDKKGEKEEKED